MKFADLPLELVRPILIEAVRLRGYKRGLRLRLVCKLFADEVYEALFLVGLPGEKWRTPYNCPIWKPYLSYRILHEKSEKFPIVNMIRKIATLLQEDEEYASGAEREARFREYLDIAISLHENEIASYFSLGDSDRGENASKDINIDLQVAAIRAKKCAMVKRFVESAEFLKPEYALDYYSGLFHWFCREAGAAGHVETLQSLFGQAKKNMDHRGGLVAAFCSASKAGKVDAVRFTLGLLRQYSANDSQNPGERTRFQHFLKAARTTFPETLQLVLDSRDIFGVEEFSVETLANYLIVDAMEKGCATMVKYLISLGAEYPEQMTRSGLIGLFEILSGAREHGLMDMLRLILDRGFDPTDTRSDQRAYMVNDPDRTEVVRMILSHEKRSSIDVNLAAREGDLGLVRLLLDHGMDPNKGSPPAIVHATQLEHEAMFRLLIERGAVLDTPETGGEALRRAQEAGLDSMVSLLARHNVDRAG
ncbi:hypothetical protein BS50DRAFT_678777 [Corynespora cassiicola Philippines]|uniref:Ankyrin n=1 Tax=Corynespora cassiicola Philippines TaxID=1448308 RepID=A0A2T2NH41_CORCC|nr:hypothetical protein BS50DRAFT_678777 [Corynespora cassiicola Philippines]